MTTRARLDLACVAVAVGVLAVGLVGGARQAAFGLTANALQVLLLGVATLSAGRSAALLGADNPSRAGWLLLTGGLGAFAVAEGLDAWFEIALRTPRPFPSLVDVLFVLGYLLLVPALLRFIRVYGRSGYDVGSAGQHAAIALAALALFALLGFGPLRAVATGAGPFAERVLGVGYPLLDFATLALTLVLLRIAAAFRGGHVGRVWALLLVGLIFTCLADLTFAFLNAGGLGAPRAAMEALYLFSYLAIARGTLSEHELLVG